jgi:hypothetical protein
VKLDFGVAILALKKSHSVNHALLAHTVMSVQANARRWVHAQTATLEDTLLQLLRLLLHNVYHVPKDIFKKILLLCTVCHVNQESLQNQRQVPRAMIVQCRRLPTQLEHEYATIALLEVLHPLVLLHALSVLLGNSVRIASRVLLAGNVATRTLNSINASSARKVLRLPKVQNHVILVYLVCLERHEASVMLVNKVDTKTHVTQHHV